MSIQDIRWHQRFENYEKALSRLEEAVLKYRNGTLTDLERQGLIKAFEFTHELAWNVMKDYFTYQGVVTLSFRRVSPLFSMIKPEYYTNEYSG